MSLIVLIADDDQDDDESIVKRPHAYCHDMAGDKSIEHLQPYLLQKQLRTNPAKYPVRIEMQAAKG